MRQKVIVDGKVIGRTVLNQATGLYDAEIDGKVISLSYMNRGAATMWVKRQAAKAQATQEQPATEAPTYYRTGKGKKRHASVHCANGRRSVFTGDPIRLAADEVKDWAPCRFCCTAEEVAAFGQEAGPQAPAAAEDAMCPNTGVSRPGSRRLRDTCRDCGKEGAVNPKTGTLRAHKPAA